MSYGIASSESSSYDDQMANNSGSPGPTSDDELTLDLNTICCLPRDSHDADVVAEKLKTAGYKVIREDDKCTIYAPPDGCSSTRGVKAESTSLKSLHVKEDVVRDVSEAKMVCGGHYSFRFHWDLPLAEGQLVPQKLTVTGLLRTFKVKDVTEWARVEVTSMQWNISPNMVADEKQLGYFVDCIELKLRPKWENPSVCCRHAPKTEVATIEETKMLQEEKNGSVQLSLSKAFGATVGGGLKRTKGMQQKVTKVPCKEYWLVCDDDNPEAVFGAYYKWEMNYWENEESRDPTQQQKGILSLLPPVPKISMLNNDATVDWIWPTTADTSHQLLEWEFSCIPRAVLLTQKEKQRKFFMRKAYRIEPSIVTCEKKAVINLQLHRSVHILESLPLFISSLPRHFTHRLFYLIYLIPFILAMIAFKFM